MIHFPLIKRNKKSKKKKKEEMNEKIVVTMRCIDIFSFSPVAGSEKVPCSDCGQMTWLSHNFKDMKANKELSKVICSHCFEENYQTEDFMAYTKEQCIQDAISQLDRDGITASRENLIEVMERRLGKKLKIIK